MDQGAASYSGEHVRFADVLFDPKPLQKPHPPIWVGGESPAALRRTVKLGDAWYPGNNSQTKPLDTPARLGAGIAEVQPHGGGGRPRSGLASASPCSCRTSFEWAPHKIQDGSARRLFTGASADMAADAAALEAWACATSRCGWAGRRSRSCSSASTASAAR